MEQYKKIPVEYKYTHSKEFSTDQTYIIEILHTVHQALNQTVSSRLAEQHEAELL